MKRLRIAALAAVIAFPASLLLARVHPFGDARLFSPNPPQPLFMAHGDVPAGVRDMLMTKCADCHSTVTRTPFYGHFAPISWLLERDVLEARRHMDLSAWNTYSPDQQQNFQSKILQQARTGKMPLPQYRIIHPGSAITANDIALLSQWTRASPLPERTSAGSGEGNAVQGRLVFQKRCVGCHTLEQNREGPRLAGVFGRPSAQISGFTYSAALRNAHITWNETTLDRWLTDPDAYLPGNDMTFRVTNPQERRDLIRFLKETPYAP